MTDLRTDRATELQAAPAAEPLDRYEEQPTEPPPVRPDGVPLRRLLALARLTPPQAVEIGAEALAGAARRAEPDGGNGGSDHVTVDQVTVLADGDVLLGPAGTGTGSVLAELARSARPARPRTDPVADQLLAELDRAAAELPVGGVPVVARMLQDAASSFDRAAVRAELAALVRAVRGGVAPAGGAPPAGASSAARRPVPPRRAAPGRSRVVRRRIGAWLLSIVVLSGVVVLEVAVLRDKIAADIGLLLDAGRSGAAPSAADDPGGRPITAPAPAAAGSVTGVDLRSLADCAPGAPCTVRLLVRLHPGADPQLVTWSYLVVDRCTGATSTAPGGTVTVPPGGTRAAAVGTVPLPDVPGAAVVAVTRSPAAAASAPVLAGSCLPAGQAK